MAKVTKDDVISYLESANMLEISDLISEIEDKFGVSAAAPIAVAGAAAPATTGGTEQEEEKTEFLDELKRFGEQHEIEI